MIKYYHMTSYENLDGICEYGLVPKSGSRTRSIGDNRCAVFFSEGIINAIFMYSALLHHYNSFAGEKGAHAIKRYTKIVKELREREKKMILDEEDASEMRATIRAIDWVKQLMSYKDFYEYMGDGVYLTISDSDISDVHSDDPKDCYTTETISPNHIKVVVLKNKETGEIVDDRESVLEYFMSTTSPEEMLEDVYNVVAIKLIKDLYFARLKNLVYYNSDHFEMLEVPISSYLKNKEKNKEKLIQRDSK